MTTFYNWIQSKSGNGTGLSDIARKVRETPELTWELSTGTKRLREKFQTIGLGAIFDKVHNEYLFELSTPSKHNKGYNTFYEKNVKGMRNENM